MNAVADAERISKTGVAEAEKIMAIGKSTAEAYELQVKAMGENNFTRFKITEEDWRNRDKWAAYEKAANDMFANTSTPHAPWVLVEANDKNHARIKVLKNVVDLLEEAVG